VHGLGELQRSGQLVTTNMCVNERSYRSLPHYPELLARYGVRQLHVDIVRPESTGERDEEYLRDIMPRYSDMAPYYDEMLAGFERWNPDFDVNVGNLPYCVLPHWASRIHHGGQETITKSSDAVGLEDSMNKYEWQTSLRTYLPGCAECVFRSRCTGIFRVYLELHGGDEFLPVTREALAAMDPERRNFVFLVEPLLSALRAALASGALPPSWHLRQEASEDRRRRIEMIFADQTGATVRFRFAPPGSTGLPIIRTAAYDVDAEADVGAAADALGDLFEWLRAQLATGLEAGHAAVLEPDAIDRALHEAVTKRGRQRVAVLAERLRNRFALPGWHLEPLRWPTEGTAELVARGARGDLVEVRFTLGARGGRSQVGVEFRPADTSDRASCKPVIDELVLLLRRAQPAAAAPADAAAALAR
jgi:hypothetical protein